MNRKVVTELNGILMSHIIEKYAANGRFLSEDEYKLAQGKISNIKHSLSRVQQIR